MSKPRKMRESRIIEVTSRGNYISIDLREKSSPIIDVSFTYLSAQTVWVGLGYVHAGIQDSINDM